MNSRITERDKEKYSSHWFTPKCVKWQRLVRGSQDLELQPGLPNRYRCSNTPADLWGQLIYYKISILLFRFNHYRASDWVLILIIKREKKKSEESNIVFKQTWNIKAWNHISQTLCAPQTNLCDICDSSEQARGARLSDWGGNTVTGKGYTQMLSRLTTLLSASSFPHQSLQFPAKTISSLYFYWHVEATFVSVQLHQSILQKEKLALLNI